jgi:hypothetical protein
MINKRLQFLFGLLCLHLTSTTAFSEADAFLQYDISATSGLAFNLVGGSGSGSWLLQHSSDARRWEDLLFLESINTDEKKLGIEFPWGALPVVDRNKGFFRASQLLNEHPIHRRFLTERAKWRLSGNKNYDYNLRQNWGQISWRGAVNVVDQQVASYETIDLQPPFVEDPEVPSIDGLFESIARAIAANAATIEVTWDPVNGIPTSCFIDWDLLLSDEERSWNIDDFNPAQ